MTLNLSFRTAWYIGLYGIAAVVCTQGIRGAINASHYSTISESVMVYDDIVDIKLIEILFILLLASVIMTALVNTLLYGA